MAATKENRIAVIGRLVDQGRFSFAASVVEEAERKGTLTREESKAASGEHWVSVLKQLDWNAANPPEMLW